MNNIELRRLTKKSIEHSDRLMIYQDNENNEGNYVTIDDIQTALLNNLIVNIEEYQEITEQNNSYTIDFLNKPFSIINLTGSTTKNVYFNNLFEGCTGKILIFQNGNATLKFPDGIYGKADISLQEGSIVLINYFVLSGELYIYSTIIVGPSKTYAYQDLSNVEESVIAEKIHLSDYAKTNQLTQYANKDLSNVSSDTLKTKVGMDNKANTDLSNVSNSIIVTKSGVESKANKDLSNVDSDILKTKVGMDNKANTDLSNVSSDTLKTKVGMDNKANKDLSNVSNSIIVTKSGVESKANKTLDNVDSTIAMNKSSIYELEGSDQSYMALVYKISDSLYRSIGINTNGEPVVGTGSNLEAMFTEKYLMYQDLSNANITTSDVKSKYENYIDFTTYGWNTGEILWYYNKNGFVFISKKQGGDSSGIVTSNFTPNSNSSFTVNVTVDSIKTTNGKLYLYLCGPNDSPILEFKLLNIGKNTFVFNTQDYINNNVDVFSFVISINEAESVVSISEFNCLQNIDDRYLDETISNLQGDTLRLIGQDVVLTSSGGIKYTLNVSDSGSITTNRLYPKHSLFIGNSLLLGNEEFGMNATNKTKDYFNIVKNRIVEEVYNNYTFKRIFGVAFEGATQLEDSNNWINNTLLPELSPKLDLVVIQLGDNVNTSEKKIIFKNSCISLISNIKRIAPKATIAWVYGWYEDNDNKTVIQNAIKQYGGVYIEIGDINISTNQSKIGTVITYDTVKSQSITYDTLEITSSNQLKITFTVDSNQYTSSINVNSYNNNSRTKTVSWEGYEKITVDSGIASHPNDSGFQAIAERIIEKLKYNS